MSGERSIHVSFRISPRSARYRAVYEWLRGLDAGLRSTAIREALLAAVSGGRERPVMPVADLQQQQPVLAESQDPAPVSAPADPELERLAERFDQVMSL